MTLIRQMNGREKMHVIKAMSMRGDMDEGKASTCSMTCIKVDES